MSAVNVLEPPTRGKVVLNTTLDRSISSAGLTRLQKPPEISFGFVLMTTTITPPFTGLYRISLFRAVILPVVAQVLEKLANFEKVISGKPKFTPEPCKDCMSRGDDPNDYFVHERHGFEKWWSQLVRTCKFLDLEKETIYNLSRHLAISFVWIWRSLKLLLPMIYDLANPHRKNDSNKGSFPKYLILCLLYRIFGLGKSSTAHVLRRAVTATGRAKIVGQPYWWEVDWFK
ncbi:hypothetical protein SDJN03_13821, partial [Cucurbita argyrosperma subsp. sororia]